jgi:hypothetical protein
VKEEANIGKGPTAKRASGRGSRHRNVEGERSLPARDSTITAVAVAVAVAAVRKSTLKSTGLS